MTCHQPAAKLQMAFQIVAILLFATALRAMPKMIDRECGGSNGQAATITATSLSAALSAALLDETSEFPDDFAVVAGPVSPTCNDVTAYTRNASMGLKVPPSTDLLDHPSQRSSSVA